MKLFSEKNISAEEFLNSVEQNLVKNASVNEQSNSLKYVKALNYLSEAADLFEKSGNYNKANEITTLISSLALFNEKIDAKIQSKIASINDAIDGLISKLPFNDEVKAHYHNSAINKIASLLSVNVRGSSFEEKYANLKNVIFKLKETYDITPKTLKLASEAVEVANSTLKVVSEDEEKSWED